MECAWLLNSTGRNLLAVTDQNPQQRWKDFLGASVRNVRSERAHERASEVINGLNRSKMALAMEYVMGTPVGLQVAQRAQVYLRATKEPPRTVVQVLQKAMQGEEVMAEMATILLQWSRTRQPLYSFQAWLKQLTLEKRKEAENEEKQANPHKEMESQRTLEMLNNITEELEQREDDEITWTCDRARNAQDRAPNYEEGWTRRRIVTYNVNSLVAALARPEGRLLSISSIEIVQTCMPYKKQWWTRLSE